MTVSPRVGAAADRLRSIGPAWLALLLGVLPLVYGADRGFDTRDEAFYLQWILQPDGYDATIHVFGVPLHLVYVGLGRSLIALRLVGVAALATTMALLGGALRRYYRQRFGLALNDLPVWAALFSLTFYSFWIMTPSYNLLANCGAALVFAGALIWGDTRNWSGEVAAATCVGLGGTLCFFGKPTLAALVALAIVGYLALQARRSLLRAVGRGATAGAICVVTLLPTILLTMPLARFVGMVRQGQRVLDIGNSLTALPLKTLREVADASPLWWMSLTLLAVALWLGRAFVEEHANARRLRAMAAAILMLDLLAATGAAIYGVVERQSPYTVMVLAIPMHAAAMAAAATAISRPGGDAARLSWSGVLPLLILLVMPFAIALGTVNNILVQTEISASFTLLVAVVATSLWGDERLRRTTLWVTALVAVVLVWWAAAVPFYYATSIVGQDHAIHPWFTRDTLRVDAGVADYAGRLERLAVTAHGAPVIDLSGIGPGSALLLQGRAPYYPWLAPGFSGVADRADLAWNSLTALERSRAWIIGPIDPAFATTRVARAILASPDHYTLADHGPGVFWQHHQKMLVWRPRDLAQPQTAPAERPSGRM